MPALEMGVTARRVRRSTRMWALAAVAGALLAILVAGSVVDVGGHASTAQRWTATLGTAAPAAYVLVYVTATLLGLPGLPFALLSPVLFGIGPAIVVMVVASALSAAVAFLIARYVARDALIRHLRRTRSFARVSALVEAHDWAVIPLVRIVPVAPFAVVNYGFGLTGISFWRYLAWSELGLVPATLVQVIGAGVLYDAAARGTTARALLAVAAAAALALAARALSGRRAVPTG